MTVTKDINLVLYQYIHPSRYGQDTPELGKFKLISKINH